MCEYCEINENGNGRERDFISVRCHIESETPYYQLVVENECDWDRKWNMSFIPIIYCPWCRRTLNVGDSR